MKKLISLNYVATLVLALGIMVAFDSCTEDPCKDVTCVNGSTVTVGDLCTCDCEDGWSGPSCTIEDECITNNVTCLNGGVCESGLCECAAGYVGDSCQTLISSKFIGTWAATDDCSASGTASYTATITAQPGNVLQVRVSGIWDDFYVNDVIASVSGTTLTIDSQDPDSDGFPIVGTGTIVEGATSTLTISFTVSETGTSNTDVCTSTWTK